ncbi:hypothetical protein RI367_003271 [Sorochytrium milnesiophthora]
MTATTATTMTADWRSTISGLLKTDAEDGGPSALATLDNWLFYTHNRSVCALNLREVKKQHRDQSALTSPSPLAKLKLQKPSSTTATQSITLDADDVDFDASALLINGEGTMMAVVGDTDLVVLKLPMQRLQQCKDTRVACESYCILDIDLTPGDTHILKVVWHPLSATASHLLVLTSDGRLRMYDVCNSLNEPEQSMSFLQNGVALGASTSESDAANTTFSAFSEQSSDVVSFCLGHAPPTVDIDRDHYVPTDIWGLFSVYGLMRNGDIYALCPVVPLSCILSEAQLKTVERAVAQLPDKTTLTARNQQSFLQFLQSHSELIDLSSNALASTPSRGISFDSPSAVSTPSKTSLRRSQTATQSPASVHRHDNDEDNVDDPVLAFDTLLHSQRTGGTSSLTQHTRMLLVSAPLYPDIVPAPTGPALLRPLSHNIRADTELVQARDILLLPTAPTNVLAVAWDNGLVDMYLELDKPQARWGRARPRTGAHTDTDGSFTVSVPDPDTAGDDEQLTLVLYETADLGLLERFERPTAPDTLTLANERTRMVLDPRYTDTVYVMHAAGVHSVCVAPWLPAISASDASDEQEQQPQSQVLRLVTTTATKSTTGNAVTCIAVTLDRFLGATLLASTAKRDLVALELHHRIDSTATAAASPTRHDTSDAKPMTSPALEELERMARVTATPVIVQGSLVPESAKDGISEEQLALVGEYISRFVTQGQVLKTAGRQILERIKTLRGLLVVNAGNLAKLHQAATKAAAAGEHQTRRVDQHRTALTQLLDAQDAMLQALFDLHTPELTTVEKDLMRDLRLVQATCGELDKKTRKLKRQSDVVLPEFAARCSSSSTTAKTSTAQVSDAFAANVSVVLEQHADQLEDMQTQLQRIKLAVSSSSSTL